MCLQHDNCTTGCLARSSQSCMHCCTLFTTCTCFHHTCHFNQRHPTAAPSCRLTTCPSSVVAVPA
jgi:hypothetical protein